MTLLGVTAILESAHIYLKAGYAFGFLSSVGFIFVSVWAAPTKSESIMREIFGNIIEEVPMKLVDLSTPKPIPRPRPLRST
jgi:hypothetical protein